MATTRHGQHQHQQQHQQSLSALVKTAQLGLEEPMGRANTGEARRRRLESYFSALEGIKAHPHLQRRRQDGDDELEEVLGAEQKAKEEMRRLKTGEDNHADDESSEGSLPPSPRAKRRIREAVRGREFQTSRPTRATTPCVVEGKVSSPPKQEASTREMAKPRRATKQELKELDEIRREVNERCSNVERKQEQQSEQTRRTVDEVEEVREELEEMKQRLKRTEESQENTLDGHMAEESIRHELEAIKDRVARAEESQESREKELKEAVKSLHSVTEASKGVEGEVRKGNERVESLESRLTTLEGRVKDRWDGLEADASALWSALGEKADKDRLEELASAVERREWEGKRMGKAVRALASKLGRGGSNRGATRRRRPRQASCDFMARVEEAERAARASERKAGEVARHLSRLAR